MSDIQATKDAPLDCVRELDGVKIQNATHKVICFIDTLPINEAERYAALLAATYSQKRFMLEDCKHNREAVPLVERLHEETMEALRERNH